MLNKIDSRNYLKAWIAYMVTAVVAVIGSAVAMYVTFASRVQALAIKAESASAGVHHHGEDMNDLLGNMALTTNDKVVLGIIIGIMAALVIGYWVMVVESLIKQTRKDGTNTQLFGWLAVFFNMLAVAGYFIYRYTLVKCSTCGKLQQRKDTLYCRYCGEAIAKDCKSCGARGKINDAYCHKCGEAF